MKITEELIDQILDQGENGALDPSYMENPKYLILEDEDVELTEEDHAYLISWAPSAWKASIAMGSIKMYDEDHL
jgi:hypothetical protein